MGGASEYETVKEELDEEIKLNLGLSLGGKFGMEKSSKTLVRSSSMASCLHLVRDDNEGAAPPPTAAYRGLARTSSLPLETEEEWRKRKEQQTLRRMAAKRRRSEKHQRCGSGGRGNLCLEERKEFELSLAAVKREGSHVGSGSNQDMGSFGTKTRENISKTTKSEIESSSKRSSAVDASRTHPATNSMDEMPCVFTKGGGPNGRRVDGILYKYGTGEDVRIMCICHGCFHSPAEFIKHAGGADVDHPLKHIVVNWNCSCLL